MKLPFDFGVKLLFRLLVPGFILSLGLFPLVRFILDSGGWALGREYPFWVTVAVSGWLIDISDMAIYTLYEGRRFWPKHLRNLFLSRETRRLERIKQSIKTSEQQGGLGAAEAYFDARRFPLDEDGTYTVLYPSRLGNLMAAYEDYPYRVYAMDSVFYWYRIWLNMDKDAREEYDNKQALADSTIYVSFASYVVGLLWVIWAIISFLQAPSLLVGYIPGPRVSLMLSVGFLLTGFLIYRGSLHLHAEFGEFFKSLFDVYENQVDISQIVKEVSDLKGDPSILKLSRKDQLELAWRYMQYGLIRCGECDELLLAASIGDHVCKSQANLQRPTTKAASLDRIISKLKELF
jgi:hypothetical protein